MMGIQLIYILNQGRQIVKNNIVTNVLYGIGLYTHTFD